MPSARRAVFLDRDGTLIFDRGYMHRPSDLRLRPHVSQGLRELQDRGFDLVLVTDSADVIAAASWFATEHKITLSFLIEIDCGEHRSGLPADSPDIVALARSIGP